MRFTESSFEEADTHIDNEESATEGNASEPTTITPRSMPKRPACKTLHIVVTESAPTMTLKLLRMHELPEGMLERTLVSPADKATVRATKMGVTCRAVRAGDKPGDVVFNGRIGQPLPMVSAAEEADPLSTASFPLLQGDSLSPAEAPPVREWKFKNGEEVPSVKQWLAGMGQTELVEPEQRPEMPKDAKKMLAIDQNPTMGRVRVPKGAAFLPADSDNDGERTPQASSSTALKAGFQQLLQARAAGDSESDSSDTSSQASEDSDNTATEANVTFGSLLNKKPENDRPAPPRAPNAPMFASGHLRNRSANAPQLRERSSGGSPHKETPDSSTGSQSASQDSFPSYGKPFAVTDNVGLTADAASQARWEIEHHQPRVAKKSKGKIQLASMRSSKPLSPQSTSGSAPMSLSTGSEVQRLKILPTPPSMAATSQATIRSYAGDEPCTNPWERRIVEKRLPSGKLIDDTASMSKAPAMLPPGLAPSHDDRAVLNQLAAVSGNEADGSLNSKLVDDTDGPVATKHAVPMAPLQSNRLLKATQQTFERPPQIIDDEDEIVERLQPQSDEPEKRYTMRQKAPKKSKGTKIKVELPLPDPVPPPKKKKVATEATAASGPSRQQQTASSSQPKPAVVPARLTDIQRLDEFFKEISVFGARIEVQFGLILTVSDDKSLRKAVLNPDVSVSAP